MTKVPMALAAGLLIAGVALRKIQSPSINAHAFYIPSLVHRRRANLCAPKLALGAGRSYVESLQEMCGDAPTQECLKEYENYLGNLSDAGANVRNSRQSSAYRDPNDVKLTLKLITESNGETIEFTSIPELEEEISHFCVQISEAIAAKDFEKAQGILNEAKAQKQEHTAISFPSEPPARGGGSRLAGMSQADSFGMRDVHMEGFRDTVRHPISFYSSPEEMIEVAEEMILQEEMEIEARLEHEEWYAEADPYTQSEISRINTEREAAEVAVLEATRVVEEAEIARLNAERLVAEEQCKRIAAEKAALAAVEAKKAQIKAESLAAEEKGKRIAAEKAALAAGVEAEAKRAAEEAEKCVRLDAERLAAEEQCKRIAAEKAVQAALEAKKAQIKAESLAAEEQGKRIAAEKSALAAGVKAEAKRVAEAAESARLDAERLAAAEHTLRIAAEKSVQAAVEAEKAQIKAERLAAEEQRKPIAAEKSALAAGVEAENLPSRREQRDGMSQMEGFRDTRQPFKSSFGSQFMD